MEQMAEWMERVQGKRSTDLDANLNGLTTWADMAGHGRAWTGLENS